jgi:hypothetical protein
MCTTSAKIKSEFVVKDCVNRIYNQSPLCCFRSRVILPNASTQLVAGKVSGLGDVVHLLGLMLLGLKVERSSKLSATAFPALITAPASCCTAAAAGGASGSSLLLLVSACLHILPLFHLSTNCLVYRKSSDDLSLEKKATLDALGAVLEG